MGQIKDLLQEDADLIVFNDQVVDEHNGKFISNAEACRVNWLRESGDA